MYAIDHATAVGLVWEERDSAVCMGIGVSGGTEEQGIAGITHGPVMWYPSREEIGMDEGIIRFAWVDYQETGFVNI